MKSGKVNKGEIVDDISAHEKEIGAPVMKDSMGGLYLLSICSAHMK